MPRLRNVVLVLSFVAVAAAPTVASVAGLEPMRKLDEKRALAPKPPQKLWALRTTAQVASFAQDWEKYFNDHFGLRKFLIGTHRLLTFHVLRTSPNPLVVVGEASRDGQWLYYEPSSIKDGVGLASVMGKKPYTATELQAMVPRLRQATVLAKANNIPLLIAICPDKQTMYPEHLPSKMRPPPGTKSRLDQFWIMAAGLEGVPLLDLRIPLREARERMLLYYPGDTHWDLRGGLVSYAAIARALHLESPFPEPLAVTEAPGTVVGEVESDLIKMLGLPTKIVDRVWYPTLPGGPEVAAKKRGKLLVLGDSYFEGMRPYFELHFATVKKINAIRSPFTLGLTQAMLDAEKPDVVLVEAVERYWTID